MLTASRHIALLLAGLALSRCAPATDWELASDQHALFQVTHKSAPVVTTGYAFWGAKWAWTGVPVNASPAAEGTAFSGEVSALKVKIAGTIKKAAENQLVWAYELTATQPLKGIIGGGLEFRLALDSASLGGKSAAPLLLENNAGWRWEVAPGQNVEVKFTGTLAQVYFERGNKNQIRAFFLGENVEAGPQKFTMAVSLPAGGQVVKSLAERYGPLNRDECAKDLFAWDTSPVDLSFLNASEKPAGKRGFVTAKDDDFVFADGTKVRFWGGNIQAYALFRTAKENAQKQARRISQLGFNLMRIHHHDSMGWVDPTVIDKKQADSQHLDAAALDALDWWVKCLEDEGVYVWLDLHVGRLFKTGDNIQNFSDFAKGKDAAEAKGYCYYNTDVQKLMQAFAKAYLGHVNPHTGKAYKDDPGVMGLLITNENDLTHHFGNALLGDKGVPLHNKIFEKDVKDFCAKTGLDATKAWRTWENGESKIYLNEAEHRFNESFLSFLKTLGAKVPASTTNYWGGMGMCGLPALADSGVIDTHSYGGAEELSGNPRYNAGFLTWLGAAQVYGKPLVTTEWNIEGGYPAPDRCTAPLFVAGVAALQGWDGPMIYGYSQTPLNEMDGASPWSSFNDPAMMGVMPAAALLYRQGHVAPAKTTYCLQFDREQLYFKGPNPNTSAAVRTLLETSRLTIGLPETKELPWLKPAKPGPDVKVVTDPNQDFIPPDQTFVQSDTGEVKRDWRKGVQTIDTPRSQAVQGFIGGDTVQLKDVEVKLRTPKAVVAVQSLDGSPLASSKKLLITVMARVILSANGKPPFLSEPIEGTIAVRAPAGLTLVPLKPDGSEGAPIAAPYADGRYTLTLGKPLVSHWFLLK